MTITFENNNAVIVYALEKIIAHARRTQQIFVANCVWWLGSVNGLERGLIAQIDDLGKQSVASLAKDRELLAAFATSTQEKRQSSPVALSRQARGISIVPQDIPEESRIIDKMRHIHRDRVLQVQDTNFDVSDLDLDSSGNEPQLRIVQQTEQFIRKSRRERRKLDSQK